MISTITNLQRAVRINQPAWKSLVGWLMSKTQAMDPSRVWLECSVVLVGHRRMTEINEQVLHHEGTTDVITFHYPSLPGEPTGWRGEIVINTQEAIEIGTDRSGGVARELALYLAHGCQHLGGADDQTSAERAAMARRQTGWLRQADRLGLIQPLLK